jgi:hypothetical protein
VDEAVKAYGTEGKKREKALRTLDSEYQKASAEISRICGEKQYAFRIHFQPLLHRLRIVALASLPKQIKSFTAYSNH